MAFTVKEYPKMTFENLKEFEEFKKSRERHMKSKRGKLPEKVEALVISREVIRELQRRQQGKGYS